MIRAFLPRCLLAACAGAACALVTFPGGTHALGESARPSELQVGTPAPELRLPDPQGKEVALSSFRGKEHVLVVFLPEKPTRASLSLLKRLRGGKESFEERGVQVLCVSRATPEANAKIQEKLKLPFPMLSDAGGKAAALYEAASTGPSKGRGNPAAAPSLFLLDREGILRHMDRIHRDDRKDREALEKALAALPRAAAGKEARMKAMKRGEKKIPPIISGVEFGAITVNGRAYTKDIIVDGGQVRERDKGPSKNEKAKYGHTPLTPREKIPWDCKRLIIGTGMYGKLPVTDELEEEARKRGVELILLKTPEAVRYLLENFESEVNAILHITC